MAAAEIDDRAMVGGIDGDEFGMVGDPRVAGGGVELEGARMG